MFAVSSQIAGVKFLNHTMQYPESIKGQGVSLHLQIQKTNSLQF